MACASGMFVSAVLQTAVSHNKAPFHVVEPVAIGSKEWVQKVEGIDDAQANLWQSNGRWQSTVLGFEGSMLGMCEVCKCADRAAAE